MKPFQPVFLIGPGRSGTTLLYKLLSLHPEIAFISNYDVKLPSWLPSLPLARYLANQYRLKEWAWFARGGNAYATKRDFLRRSIPTPVEGEAIYTRCGLTKCESYSAPPTAVSAQLRKQFISLQSNQKCRAILSKRTANNRRILSLAATFPEARYIYLIRDGRAVAQSLTKVHWWNDHSLWWAKNKTPREMTANSEDMLAVAAKNWTEEVRTILKGLESVPEKNVRVVRYENLLDKPIQHLNELIDFIGVDRIEAFEQSICRLGISQRPESWTEWSQEKLDLVMKIQGNALQQLNYL